MVKRKRVLATILTAVVASSLFVGCGGGSTAKNSEQKITINLGADPKTIDPGLNSTVEGSRVIRNVFEGLTNVDKDGKPVPGVAEKWDVSEDGLTYTFHLRNNAKWSDDKPVTAKDFEYAWKRVLDPNTASEYASQMFYLKNGESFNLGKSKVDDVGIKAKDDYTLEVTLQNPTPYFLTLVATATYAPVRQDIIEANSTWTLKPDTYVSNGPFKMSQYKPKDTLELIKNPSYWNNENVKLENIDFKFLENESSALSAFKSGQLDVLPSPPAAETPKLLEDGTAEAYSYMGTYYYNLNVSPKAAETNPEAAKALNNPKVRKALALAIDREALVDQVVQGGQKPATSFVPSSVTDIDGNVFKNNDYYTSTANINEAQKLLAEAGYPNGEGFPSLEILYNTGQGHQNVAQAVQDMWNKNLGVNIELRNVERKVHLDEMQNSTYLIARDGWIADFSDPVSFLDILVTGNGQNRPGYSNAEYDKLMNQAKQEANITKRFELMHQAEDILMNDMPVIPLYEYSNVVCLNKNVKGLYISPLGEIICKDAYIEQ